MSLGFKIKMMRKIKNITQEEFAEAMNVSRQIVCRWENDITLPSVKRLIKISIYFGCSLDYLIKEM